MKKIEVSCLEVEEVERMVSKHCGINWRYSKELYENIGSELYQDMNGAYYGNIYESSSMPDALDILIRKGVISPGHYLIEYER